VYRESFETLGMRVAGQSPDHRLVESVEIPANDYFVGVQYHPEFKSRPTRSHPLFKGFTQKALERKYK
jgi:CTP synthase